MYAVILFIIKFYSLTFLIMSFDEKILFQYVESSWHVKNTFELNAKSQ